ncbi:MAG: hypothetical protein ABI693_24490 [Bryobacteraceae bacterium]
MKQLFQGLLVLIALISISCSSETPTANKMGTPEYFWSGAKETFNLKDYSKTADHLENLTKSNNQFTSQAYPWRLILLSGLSEGYAGQADSMELGGKNNRGMIVPFRKNMMEARKQSARWALQYAQAYEAFEKDVKGDTVTIAMPMPSGNTVESFQEQQIQKGILKNPADADITRAKSVDRHILLALCHALGVKDDSAKAQQMLASGKAEIPRAVFMTAMAQSLYNAGDLYTSKKLDEPDRVAYLTKHAKDALAGLPDSKDVKDLTKKIADREKSAKKGKAA